jgi:hypothetical protein
MFYLSNFARPKGAKDKKKRKARSILAKSVRDGLVGSALLVPTFALTRKAIARPLINRRFNHRKVWLNKANNFGDNSLENEFGNVFLRNKNLENLRKEYIDLKVKEYRNRPLKELILPSLALSPSIATTSLMIRAKKEGFGKKDKKK